MILLLFVSFSLDFMRVGTSKIICLWLRILLSVEFTRSMVVWWVWELGRVLSWTVESAAEVLQQIYLDTAAAVSPPQLVVF